MYHFHYLLCWIFKNNNSSLFSYLLRKLILNQNLHSGNVKNWSKTIKCSLRLIGNMSIWLESAASLPMHKLTNIYPDKLYPILSLESLPRPMTVNWTIVFFISHLCHYQCDCTQWHSTIDSCALCYKRSTILELFFKQIFKPLQLWSRKLSL